MHDGDTARFDDWIHRLHAGDDSALGELLAHFEGRLVRLTRRMLDSFPGVRRWEQTGDVLQRATLRLRRALVEVAPPGPRDFFRLAALQIRRELLNLARSYRDRPTPSQAGGDGPADRADGTDGPGDLALWTEFHERAAALPEAEREAFDLIWYQGLSQAEAAAILGVGERTVRGRWQRARLRLHADLGGRLPGA